MIRDLTANEEITPKNTKMVKKIYVFNRKTTGQNMIYMPCLSKLGSPLYAVLPKEDLRNDTAAAE